MFIFPLREKHHKGYFAFDQTWLVDGKIDLAVLLPNGAK